MYVCSKCGTVVVCVVWYLVFGKHNFQYFKEKDFHHPSHTAPSPLWSASSAAVSSSTSPPSLLLPVLLRHLWRLPHSSPPCSLLFPLTHLHCWGAWYCIVTQCEYIAVARSSFCGVFAVS